MKKIVLLFAIMMGIAVLSGCRTSDNNSQIDALATCLTENGVEMYGTDVCPYCLKQKGLFGASFEKINYTNCQKEPTKCNIKDVQAIPAWIIKGEKSEGLQPLADLAEKAGCEWTGTVE